MRAKKSLGQNFLKSPAVVRKMVETADVRNTDTVLEIGPGKGVLTQILLETGSTVIAVEKDTELIPILEERFTEQIESKQLILLNQDITDFQISQFVQDDTLDKYKIVANIPYNITGEIIRMFLESSHRPISMTLLVQKEVAKRIVARDSKESILSMSIKAYGKPKYIQKVPAMLFNPVPKVDSAVLHIADISMDFFTKYDITEEQFFRAVKQGFAQKRKKLTNNLKIDSKILIDLELDTNTRAENLTLKQWGLLIKKIANMV